MKENLEIPLNLTRSPKHPYGMLNLSDIAAMWIDYYPKWEEKLEEYILRAIKDGRTKSTPHEPINLDYQSPSV